MDFLEYCKNGNIIIEGLEEYVNFDREAKLLSEKGIDIHSTKMMMKKNLNHHINVLVIITVDGYY